VVTIKTLLYILFFPLVLVWYILKIGAIMFYYIFILMIEITKLFCYFIIWLFQTIYNIFSKKKIHINFPESSFKKTNVKSNKVVKRNYKDEEFDKEAKLWGLSKEDKRIAKEERMSPADFVEAEERDDDELITDEWEEDKYK
jgi:hypothetical protein